MIRRLFLLLLVAVSAVAQSTDVSQRMREAQQAFAAGDCSRAQAALREVVAADPQNFVAHILAARCSLKQKEYAAAVGEFRRTLEIRPDAPPAVLGLIEAYALAGDNAHRDAEVEHLVSLMKSHKISKTTAFVREQFASGENTVIAREYPYLTALRTRYAFEVLDSQQKPVQKFELVSREADQSAGARRFTLVSSEPTEKRLRVYDRGEPSYEQVVADVKAEVAGQPPSSRAYALAPTPAVVEPIPITVADPSDPRLQLQPGDVAIEYIAHSCFRIQTAKGTRLLIDPFASRMWLGYDFPARLAADAVLITHPHYDHDADVLIGHAPPPWTPDVRVMRNAGNYKVADVTITGIRGKHADPWGKEFGQTNTIWLLEIDGLRIAHLGDSGPLTEANLKELGRIDILMMPIDAKHHILKDAEVTAIQQALAPRVLIPMHYRLPDLEASPDSPEGLGEITPWLAGQQNVVHLDRNVAIVSAATLLPSHIIVVPPHSQKVTR